MWTMGTITGGTRLALDGCVFDNVVASHRDALDACIEAPFNDMITDPRFTDSSPADFGEIQDDMVAF